jgi:membrane protease YdiL (CAAX protease family)
MRDDRNKLAAWTTFVVVFAALNYAARFSADKPDRDVLYTWSAAILGAVELAVVLGIVLLIARDRPRDEYLGLRRPSSWGTAFWVGLVVIMGVFVISGLLAPFLNAGDEQGLVPKNWEPSRAAAFAANFVVVALLAPIVEELTFRGLGYRLLAPFGRWTAVILVGLAFGLAHGLVEALPILVFFGAGLAYLRSRTGSVYPSILVHATFNGLVLIVVVATG